MRSADIHPGLRVGRTLRADDVILTACAVANGRLIVGCAWKAPCR